MELWEYTLQIKMEIIGMEWVILKIKFYKVICIIYIFFLYIGDNFYTHEDNVEHAKMIDIVL